MRIREVRIININEIKQEVRARYYSINNRWLEIHLRLLWCCTLVSGVLEMLMLIPIQNAGTLNCSIPEYFFRYVMVPFALNSVITYIGYSVLRRKNVRVVVKQYTISILFSCLAFVLQLMHSGFVAVLVVAVFPILMTTIYENQKLTAIVSGLAVTTQIISGYCLLFDPSKVINPSYTINLIILVATVFCTWLGSKSMIEFMKMKREIVLNNEFERFKLQRDINIDGLTNIGNKLALMSRLNDTTDDFKEITYLAMLDLDDFKAINDTYGHIFGDDVLRGLGEALQNMSEGAEAYRYGGDEFCIVFSEQSLECAVNEIKMAQTYLNEHIKVPDGKMDILFSAGIASNTKNKSITKLTLQADQALYQAKNNSRGEVFAYNYSDM